MLLKIVSNSYNDCVLGRPRHDGDRIYFDIYRQGAYVKTVWVLADEAPDVSEGITISYAKTLLDNDPKKNGKPATSPVTGADWVCKKYEGNRELWRHRIAVENVGEKEYDLRVHIESEGRTRKTDSFSVPVEFMEANFPGVGYRGDLSMRDFMREWRRWKSAQNGNGSSP